MLLILFRTLILMLSNLDSTLEHSHLVTILPTLSSVDLGFLSSMLLCGVCLCVDLPKLSGLNLEIWFSITPVFGAEYSNACERLDRYFPLIIVRFLHRGFFFFEKNYVNKKDSMVFSFLWWDCKWCEGIPGFLPPKRFVHKAGSHHRCYWQQKFPSKILKFSTNILSILWN